MSLTNSVLGALGGQAAGQQGPTGSPLVQIALDLLAGGGGAGGGGLTGLVDALSPQGRLPQDGPGDLAAIIGKLGGDRS